MNTKKTILLISLLLLGSLLPVVGGHTETDSIVNIGNIGEEIPISGPVYRYFLIGRITDLSLHYEYESVNYTTFTTVRVFGLEVQRYNIVSRAIGISHYRNMPISFPEDMFQFRGVLRNNFISGMFDYIFEE